MVKKAVDQKTSFPERENDIKFPIDKTIQILLNNYRPREVIYMTKRILEPKQKTYLILDAMLQDIKKNIKDEFTKAKIDLAEKELFKLVQL